MHWPVLIMASLFEAVIPLLIIRSENYSHLLYTPLLVVTVICSILGLRFAMQVIPLSVAYMVWTALGILGTALIGVMLLGERLDTFEIASLLLIVIAVAGLRVSASAGTTDLARPDGQIR